MNLGKIVGVIALAVALTAVTAVSGQGASLSATVTMPVGGVIDLAASGVTQVDVAPTGVAGVWASVDHVTMWGLQGGSATLVITWPGGIIEARPVEVTPATPGRAQFAQGGCPSSVGVAATGPLGADGIAPPPATDVKWSPGEWQVLWNSAGSSGRLMAAQSLNSPVGMLGIQSGPGVNMVWDRWNLTASQTVDALTYQMPLGAGLMMQVGDSTLGPIGEATVVAGDVTASSVALLSQSGQVVTAAQATFALGPVGVGYLAGPTGGVPSLELRTGSVEFYAADWPGAGPSVALAVGLGTGVSLQAAWAAQTGWTAKVAMWVGPGSTPGAANDPAAAPRVLRPPSSCRLGMSSAASASQQ